MDTKQDREHCQERLIKPKVSFELPSVEAEARELFNFCYGQKGEFDWSETVYKWHPKLKDMVSGIEDREEFYSKCEEYARSFLLENAEFLNSVKVSFEKSFGEIEEEFFAEIMRDFETECPREIKEIKVNISVNPICPRYLDEWSFNVFYKSPNDLMRRTAIHEMIHLFYFKKWLEVFPGYDKAKFNNPHPEWRLSEIVVNPILNENPVFQKMIGGNKSLGYKEFQDIKIDGRSLIEFFGEIYKERLEGKISFGDFIRKSWEEYRRNLI